MTENFVNDRIFREFKRFSQNLLKDLFRDLQDFGQSTGTDQLKGSWKIQPIRQPGVRGFVAHGQWRTLDSPFTGPQQAATQAREPLTDIFDEEKHLKIYMELPGVNKSDIQLNLTESRAEVRAKNFTKILQLPKGNIQFEKATASYKNGVLEITVPKAEARPEAEKKKTIAIE